MIIGNCNEKENNKEKEIKPRKDITINRLPSQSLGSRPLADVAPSFIAEHDISGTEYPIGQLGSAVLAVSSPAFSCTPSLPAGRKDLASVQALLSNNKSSPELPTVLPAQIRNTAPY